MYLAQNLKYLRTKAGKQQSSRRAGKCGNDGAGK